MLKNDRHVFVAYNKLLIYFAFILDILMSDWILMDIFLNSIIYKLVILVDSHLLVLQNILTYILDNFCFLLIFSNLQIFFPKYGMDHPLNVFYLKTSPSFIKFWSKTKKLIYRTHLTDGSEGEFGLKTKLFVIKVLFLSDELIPC